MTESDTYSDSVVKLVSPEHALEDPKDNKEKIVLNTKHRQLIFILMCLGYCFSSCDGGIIPQQNTNIQYDFQDKGETKVGLFSSFDYVGRIVGAVVMTVLIDRLNRQIFLSMSFIVKAVTLFMPTFTETYNWNLAARFISGIPQTLLTSYGTIWTEQFGRKKGRSLMLALFQLFALGGIIVGYGIGIICNAILPVPEEVKNYAKNEDDSNHNNFFLGWRLGFAIEGTILATLGIILLFCPQIFFSKTFYLNEDNDENGDDNIGREKTTEEINKEKTGLKQSTIDFFKQIPKILCTKIFIFMSIGNTVAFFGMRVIQFYADKYMEFVLGVEQNLKFIYFGVLSVSGPILGVLIIGIIMQKIGGYGSRKGMVLIIMLNVIASLISITITISLNTFISLASCWIYLFCLAAITPLQGGLIIASLPQELKGNGYSINMFFLNAIGSFPSSYVFGLVCDFISDNYDSSDMKYRTTMRIVMYYNFVGLLLISIAAFFRFKIKGDLKNKNENLIDSKENIDMFEGEDKEG